MGTNVIITFVLLRSVNLSACAQNNTNFGFIVFGCVKLLKFYADANNLAKPRASLTCALVLRLQLDQRDVGECVSAIR